MAVEHLSVKIGKKGYAAAHASYVMRAGDYANLKRGERLEAVESGNMPAWAVDDVLSFWSASDAHERANGATYREFEIALPRELSARQRLDLVREFVGRELGDRHAFTFGIHCPSAASDGKEQPHAHIMFSERRRDGIERDPGQYFKRYNAKAPEKGGAKKGWGDRAGQTLSPQERAEELKALRARWEQSCNAALERAGHAERIDMRSYSDRGIDIPRVIKTPSSVWRTKSGKAEVRAARAARAEAVRAHKEMQEAQAGIAGIDISAEFARIAANNDRKKREREEAEARRRAEAAEFDAAVAAARARKKRKEEEEAEAARRRSADEAARKKAAPRATEKPIRRAESESPPAPLPQAPTAETLAAWRSRNAASTLETVPAPPATPDPDPDPDPDTDDDNSYYRPGF